MPKKMSNTSAVKVGKSKGAAYPHITRILAAHTRDGLLSVEIGCGGKPYKPFVNGTYYGTDVTADLYAGEAPDILCSGEALPFKDSTIDLVFIVHALYLIPDCRRVFQEVRRVLKPGGKFLIFDYNWRTAHHLKKKDPGQPHQFSPMYLWYLCLTNGFQPKWVFYLPEPRSLKGKILYRLGVGSILNHLITDSLIFCGEKSGRMHSNER